MRIKSHGVMTPILLGAFAFAAIAPMASFLYLKSLRGPVPAMPWMFSLPFFLLGPRLGVPGDARAHSIGSYWALGS